MAVVLKKKTQELTDREKDTLAALGLGPDTPEAPVPPPKKVGVTIRKVGMFSAGDKVVVTNDLYTWVEWWKPGDTGVVVKAIPAPNEAGEKRRRYAVVEVKLDNVRVHGRQHCLFHAWELEAAQ